MLNRLLAPISKPALLGLGFLSSAITGATTALIFTRKEKKVRKDMRTRLVAAMLSATQDAEKAWVRKKIIEALQIEANNENEPLPEELLEQVKETLKGAYGEVVGKEIFEKFFTEEAAK